MGVNTSKLAEQKWSEILSSERGEEILDSLGKCSYKEGLERMKQAFDSQSQK